MSTGSRMFPGVSQWCLSTFLPVTLLRCPVFGVVKHCWLAFLMYLRHQIGQRVRCMCCLFAGLTLPSGNVSCEIFLLYRMRRPVQHDWSSRTLATTRPAASSRSLSSRVNARRSSFMRTTSGMQKWILCRGNTLLLDPKTTSPYSGSNQMSACQLRHDLGDKQLVLDIARFALFRFAVDVDEHLALGIDLLHEAKWILLLDQHVK